MTSFEVLPPVNSPAGPPRSASIRFDLEHSAFIADLRGPEREPARIAGGIVLGTVAGLLAATVGLLIVLALWMSLSGGQPTGFAGIGRVALRLQQADGRDLPSALLVMVVATATNVPFVLGFVGIAALLVRRRLKDYVTAAPHIRWRLLLAGLLLSVLAIVPMMIVDRLTSNGAPPLPVHMVSPHAVGRLAYVIAAVLLLIPAAAAEEVLVRGWMLRQIAAFTKRPAVLIVVTGLAFSALHGDFSAGAFLTRALMGAGFAYMTLRLGGVEFSTGAHAANNILIVLFIEPLTLKNVAAPTQLTTGSIAEDLILIVGYLVITEAVVRIAPLRRWAGLASPADGAPLMGPAEA